MSDSIKVEEIVVTVSYTSDDGYSFSYSGCDNGSKGVNSPCRLKYILNDESNSDLSFAGVAFDEPLSDIITDVISDAYEKSITLVDPCLKSGVVSFQFGFNIGKNPETGSSYSGDLLLLSKDPEVVNKLPN